MRSAIGSAAIQRRRALADAGQRVLRAAAPPAQGFDPPGQPGRQVPAGLPEIGAEASVGYGGGISLGTAIGVPLTAAESRIAAAIFGGGFFVYQELIEAARRITVPVQFLLPWDDEHVDRQSALALFDAFASREKTLHANPGDHRTIRWTGVDSEFLSRHLGRAGAAS
ncbi:MAG TPA: hypothetical protein VFQ68_44860 [Streptosporangiaceae bacterium]|nr:hypothetical protein [Streptosporangiaceae bacterium]